MNEISKIEFQWNQLQINIIISNYVIIQLNCTSMEIELTMDRWICRISYLGFEFIRSKMAPGICVSRPRRESADVKK